MEEADEDVLKDRYFDINGIQVPKRTMWTKGGTEFINGASFQCQGSFGCHQRPLNMNVFMFSNEKIIYLCGKHIVIYDIISKEMSFLQKNSEDEQVTAFNYYYEKEKKGPRLLVAVGLGKPGKSLPQAKIYKSHKSFNSTLVLSHLGMNAQIVDIAFLFKKKNIITLTKVFYDNSCVVTIWDRKKETALKHVVEKINIEKLIIPSLSFDQFIVQGPQFVQLWHYSQEDIQKHPVCLLDNLLPSESIIDIQYIPKTPFIGAITCLNNLHFFKYDVYLQKIEVEVPIEMLIEDYNKENFFVTEGMSEQQSFEFLKNKEDVKTYLISCLTPVEQGFLLGFAGIPLIMVYKINQQNDILEFSQILKFKYPNAVRIHNMHCSPDNRYTILAVQHTKKGLNGLMDDTEVEKTLAKIESVQKTGRSFKFQTLQWLNQLPQSSLGRIDIYVLEYYRITTDYINFHDPFIPIFEQGVNSDEVIDIAICPSKSLFLTICKDKSLKIWYFNQTAGQFHCQQSQKFNETPLSISIHPLTIQCAIGFKEGMKSFFLLEDGLKPAFSTQLKECRAVCYSEMGHLLAAANFNLINIYNPYTFNLINQFTGHNGCIKGIGWHNNDKLIKSVCQQGTIIIWEYFDEKIMLKKVDSNYSTHQIQKASDTQFYAALEYDYVYDLLITTSHDKKLKIFGDKGSNLIYEHETTPYVFTSITIITDMNVILFGTNGGSIRMYLWPFDFSLNIQEHSETAVHQQDISVLAPTPDLKYLISGSIDGSIFFIRMREYLDGNEVLFNAQYYQQQQIEEQQRIQQQQKLKQIGNIEKDKSKENQNVRKRRNLDNIYCMNKVAISCFSSQEWLTDKIKELEFRIQNLNHDIEDEKDKLQSSFDSKIEVLQNQVNQDYKNQKLTDDQIIDDVDIKYEALKKQFQQNRQNQNQSIVNLQKKSENELLNQYKHLDLLKRKVAEYQKECQSEYNRKKKMYQEEKHQVMQEEEQNYNELQSKYRKALENIKLDEKKFKEAQSQQEWENDQLLKQTMQKLEQKKSSEENKAGKLRDQISKKSKEVEKFHKRINSNGIKIQDKCNQIELLREERIQHEQKMKEFNRELSGKEEIIKTKEAEIKKYRNLNQHLQNYRAVYDYRVQNLQEERMPLADHLNDIEKNIKIMYRELLDEASDSKKMKLKLEDSQDVIKDLKKQLKAKNDLVNYCKGKVKRFEYEVSFMLNNMQIEEWPTQMPVINQKFFEGKNSIEKLIVKNREIGTHLASEKIENILKNMNFGIEEQQKTELVNDRDQLSKKVSQINKINKQKEDDKGNVVTRVQNQNTHLLTECNSLREERKKLQEKIQQLVKAVKLVETENNRLDQNVYGTGGQYNNNNFNKKGESFANDLDSFLINNTTNLLHNNQKQNHLFGSGRNGSPFQRNNIINKDTIYQKYQKNNPNTFQRSSSSEHIKQNKPESVFLTQLQKEIQTHKLNLNQQDQDSLNQMSSQPIQYKSVQKVSRSISPQKRNVRIIKHPNFSKKLPNVNQNSFNSPLRGGDSGQSSPRRPQRGMGQTSPNNLNTNSVQIAREQGSPSRFRSTVENNNNSNSQQNN